MKVFITALLLSVSTFSYAGNFKCFFSNLSERLFITTTLDLNRMILKVDYQNGNVDTQLLKDIGKIGTIKMHFTQDYLLSIDSSEKGSDGVSDEVYDYRGMFLGKDDVRLIGGCKEVNPR